MNLFLDTSSLFKLYHIENDTPRMAELLANYSISQIALAEIAKIEFASIVWRKVRIKEFTEHEAKRICKRFESDFAKYSFVPANTPMIKQARNLIEKYGKQGLRTLDSIQLATAISLSGQCELFVTSDKLLQSFFKQELLPVL
jgi:predicted nucleic acid-binding protein